MSNLVKEIVDLTERKHQLKREIEEKKVQLRIERMRECWEATPDNRKRTCEVDGVTWYVFPYENNAGDEFYILTDLLSRFARSEILPSLEWEDSSEESHWSIYYEEFSLDEFEKAAQHYLDREHQDESIDKIVLERELKMARLMDRVRYNPVSDK